jgi:hypothetical protein
MHVRTKHPCFLGAAKFVRMTAVALWPASALIEAPPWCVGIATCAGVQGSISYMRDVLAVRVAA